jgi:hypothetical protein
VWKGGGRFTAACVCAHERRVCACLARQVEDNVLDAYREVMGPAKPQKYVTMC